MRIGPVKSQPAVGGRRELNGVAVIPRARRREDGPDGRVGNSAQAQKLFAQDFFLDRKLEADTPNAGTGIRRIPRNGGSAAPPDPAKASIVSSSRARRNPLCSSRTSTRARSPGAAKAGQTPAGRRARIPARRRRGRFSPVGFPVFPFESVFPQSGGRIASVQHARRHQDRKGCDKPVNQERIDERSRPPGHPAERKSAEDGREGFHGGFGDVRQGEGDGLQPQRVRAELALISEEDEIRGRKIPSRSGPGRSSAEGPGWPARNNRSAWKDPSGPPARSPAP